MRLDSISAKPPSGRKRSSALKKLLRIDDKDDNDITINEPLSDAHERTTSTLEGQNMTLRPKSRFGNLAFDIVLDTPETGNAKKRPEKLAALSFHHKRTKKVKTKKDIETKMEEAAARRKVRISSCLQLCCLFCQ